MRWCLQGAAGAISDHRRGCILLRCSQLARLEAILLHLLAADERSVLPAPPLSVGDSGNNAPPISTARRNVADWAAGDGKDQDDASETTLAKLGRGQQRAAKACQCAHAAQRNIVLLQCVCVVQPRRQGPVLS